MKRCLVWCMLWLCLCLTAMGQELTGLVTRVADGDTLTLVDARGTQHRVRLWGIDCPEKAQSFGRKAGSVLAGMVLKKNVRIEVKDTDQYGRKVGRVFLGNQDINLEMVRRGLAWHYVHFARNAQDLAEAEKSARAARTGLWSEASPQAPWDFRRGQRKRRK